MQDPCWGVALKLSTQQARKPSEQHSNDVFICRGPHGFIIFPFSSEAAGVHGTHGPSPLWNPMCHNKTLRVCVCVCGGGGLQFYIGKQKGNCHIHICIYIYIYIYIYIKKKWFIHMKWKPYLHLCKYLYKYGYSSRENMMATSTIKVWRIGTIFSYV